MAHAIDQTTGKNAIAFVNEVPWHGLGQRVDPEATLEDWTREAALEWTAEKQQLLFVRDTDFHDIDGQVALVRSDTNSVLSIVSDRYQVVQPSDVVEFFQHFVEELGGYTMETLGALDGGRKVWGLAKADHKALKMAKGDRIQDYLLMSTSYDGSSPTTIQQTSVRVVCQNTLSLAAALGRKNGGTFKVRHITQWSRSKALKQLALAEGWKEFAETMERLADTKIKTVDAKKLLADILDFHGNEKKMREEDYRRTRADGRWERIEAIRNGAPGQKTAAADGTLFGLINAVTYYVDHEASAKSDDRRLDNAWFGQGEALKAKAMKTILEYIDA